MDPNLDFIDQKCYSTNQSPPPFPTPRLKRPELEETKLCIIIDSREPEIIKVPLPANRITLKQFKEFASLQQNSYKFYFRSQDPEFGKVKEEVTDDESFLPNEGNRIVAWVLSDRSTQSSLFEGTTTGSNTENRRATSNNNSPTIIDRTPSPTASNYHINDYQNSMYIRVLLNLNNYNFLGLTLVGPNDVQNSSNRGIYVGEIAKHSVVDQNGRVEVGDRVIEINNIDLRSLQNDEAVTTFRNCIDKRGAINLVFERNLNHSSPEIKSRFTLPREYATLNTFSTRRQKNTNFNDFEQPKPVIDINQLPIPIFGEDENKIQQQQQQELVHHYLQASRPVPEIPPRVNQRIHKGTHSLPRSITPRSLYGSSNNYLDRFLNQDDVNQLDNNSTPIRRQSRSVYEPSTPTPSRQLDFVLHCVDDSINSVYEAMKNDAKNLDIKDREWLRVTIKDAFLGSSLVKWLSHNVGGFANRKEAKQYAHQMLVMGLIKNPMSSSSFSEKCFYTLS